MVRRPFCIPGTNKNLSTLIPNPSRKNPQISPRKSLPSRARKTSNTSARPMASPPMRKCRLYTHRSGVALCRARNHTPSPSASPGPQSSIPARPSHSTALPSARSPSSRWRATESQSPSPALPDSLFCRACLCHR